MPRRFAPVPGAALMAALVAALVAGCGHGPDPTGPTAPPDRPGLPGGFGTQPGSEASRPATTRPPAGGAPAPTGATLTGWTVTVYYTAVQRFHTDDAERVTGCPRLECTRGDADLGSYPGSFVRAVRNEGTGRTSAGRYLNWSSDTGYWLDDAPRDTAGRPLRPFESAAADRGVLRPGTRFAIVGCGATEDGDPIGGAVCDRLRAATWTVTDEFTPGLGGDRHVDVYIGEETGPGFTGTDWYTTLNGARLRTGS